MNGKGDKPRPVDAKKYGENYDRIFRGKPKDPNACHVCGIGRVKRPTYVSAKNGIVCLQCFEAEFGPLL